MKRIELLLLSMLMVLLVGCESTIDVESEQPSGVVSEAPAPTQTPPVEVIDFIFTDSHEKLMKDFLSGCKYMIFSQTMSNGIEGQSVYSTTRYTLSVNVEQKVQSQTMRYLVVNGISHEGVGYSLYSDGDYTIVNEDGVWVEASDMYKMQVWDLSSFDNDLDVYMYLLHDLKLPVGVVGTAAGEWWTFEWTEPATDSLVVGLNYDQLLDATYKYTFRNKSGTVLPDSVSVRVGYIVEDVQYYMESVVQISSIGNTSIVMPKVGEKA